MLRVCCCLSSKDTISKAIHNVTFLSMRFSVLLLIKQRYNFESNSQQQILHTQQILRCCLSSKDTISKAIHNKGFFFNHSNKVVAYQAKIQFRKQFTTISL